MKEALLVGIIAVATILSAQTPNANPPSTQTPATAANQAPANSGTVLTAELTRGLDARKAKPGDAITAKCTEDLNINGEVLIPRNSRLVGHVVEVQVKGRGKPESTIGISFDKAVLRDGREIPLTAAIQAVAPPPTMASEVGDTDFGVRNPPPVKPRPSALLPGAIITPRASQILGSAALAANTTGAVGLQGLRLEAKPSTASSVIHSSSQNVRLESGTRLILRVSLP